MQQVLLLGSNTNGSFKSHAICTVWWILHPLDVWFCHGLTKAGHHHDPDNTEAESAAELAKQGLPLRPRSQVHLTHVEPGLIDPCLFTWACPWFGDLSLLEGTPPILITGVDYTMRGQHYWSSQSVPPLPRRAQTPGSCACPAPKALGGFVLRASFFFGKRAKPLDLSCQSAWLAKLWCNIMLAVPNCMRSSLAFAKLSYAVDYGLRSQNYVVGRQNMKQNQKNKNACSV